MFLTLLSKSSANHHDPTIYIISISFFLNIIGIKKNRPNYLFFFGGGVYSFYISIIRHDTTFTACPLSSPLLTFSHRCVIQMNYFECSLFSFISTCISTLNSEYFFFYFQFRNLFFLFKILVNHVLCSIWYFFHYLSFLLRNSVICKL